MSDTGDTVATGWLVAVTIGMLCAVLGAVATGWVASCCVRWYRISSREGNAGYFVAGLGLLGGLIGLGAGTTTARMVAGGFLAPFGAATGVVLGLAGLFLLLARLGADLPPRIDGKTLRLAVELKLPAGQALGSDARFSLLQLDAGNRPRTSEPGRLLVEQSRREEERWIVPALVALTSCRGRRVLDFRRGDETIAGFLLGMPARPTREQMAWSNWLPQPRPSDLPWPPDKPSYRFRVEFDEGDAK